MKTKEKNIFQKGITAKGDENIEGYFMSEKFDGIRALWDGKKFVTRGGVTLPSPQDFLDKMPGLKYSEPLDGELWMGRGTFQKLSSIIRGEGNDWIKEGVKFMVFDVIDPSKPFKLRYKFLRNYISYDSYFIKVIYQREIGDMTTWDDIRKRAKNIKREGGEGIMLHNPNSYYTPGRTSDILKVVNPDQGKVKVLGPFEGKGKYSGKIGGYHVQGYSENVKGQEFKIGSGLTDLERKTRLPCEEIKDFRCWGFYTSGKPRQPVFC